MKKLTDKMFFLIITAGYFFTRLVNIKIIPIFTDEAIYSYWAQVALHDPANRFMSLEDGKQPLFIWLAAVFQKFVSDPLIAGRLVSVFAGFGSAVGIYLLSNILFDKKVARIATVLYIVLPFTLLYDRLALYDSLLTMFGIYSLYFAIKIAKNPKLNLAITNGVILGLGLLTKSSAYFFLILIPISLLFFDTKRENLTKRFSRWIFLSGLSAFLALVIYNSLRKLTPLFYMISRKNLEFIRSPQEVLKNPLLHFSGNLNSIVSWFIAYNGYLLMFFAIGALIYGIYKLKKPVIIPGLYIFIPFMVELLFNKVLYPRFSLFYFPYVIILIAYAFSSLLSIKKYSKIFFAIILVSLIFVVRSSFFLLTDPPKANIAKADKHQYLNDWPAGYGVREITVHLKEQSKGEEVYVGTEGTFGLLPFALQIYFYSQPNIKIEGFWPVREIPAQVMEAAKSRKTYFVFNESQNLPDSPGNPHLKLLAKYQKGSGNSYMRLYEILP